MSARRALVQSMAGLVLLLAGFLARDSGGVVLEFTGLGLLLWAIFALAAPLVGQRVFYRVRYHYPSTSLTHNGERAGALLGVLARRGGRVTLYWRRDEDGLALFIAASATVEAALRGMLPEIWPGAVAEQVDELPPPATTSYLYLVRSSAKAAQLDFAGLCADPAGAPALWTHLTAAGWSLLVGAGDNAHEIAGLRLRALPLPGNPGLIRRLAAVYPFVTAWPARSARGVRTTSPLAMRWPHTDQADALDGERSLILPPPLGYEAPRRVWQLGLAASGGLAVGPDLARPRSWGHVLLIGGQGGERQSTALRLLAQAGAAGWGLVALDHSGHLSKQLYELAPADVRRGAVQIDLHAQRGTFRPSLLDVAAPSSGPAGQASAMLLALDTRLPVYLRFLQQIGLHAATSTTNGHSLGAIALADVGLQLLAHYRARLDGTQPPALPEVPALYSAWSEARGFTARLQQELAAWRRPDKALCAALDAAGQAGNKCAARAGRLLEQATARLGALDPADLQLYSASLRARLAPSATSPLLRAAWSEMVPASQLFAGPDAPFVLGNLGYSDSGERGAARTYGLYLLALLEALALERAALGQLEQPIAVAWEELAPAWSALKPADIARLGSSLRRGGMHLLLLDASWCKLDEAQATALRGALDNWVIGVLPAHEAHAVGAELLALGAPRGFSLGALPAGHALARCVSASADMLCTVITAEVSSTVVSATPLQSGLAQAATAVLAANSAPVALAVAAQEEG